LLESPLLKHWEVGDKTEFEVKRDETHALWVTEQGEDCSELFPQVNSSSQQSTSLALKDLTVLASSITSNPEGPWKYNNLSFD